jgi:hypothetical protein
MRPGRVFIHCLPAIGFVTLLPDEPLPDQPCIASVPSEEVVRDCRRDLIIAVSRGKAKEPFSNEHRASGYFLASSDSNMFLSAYTGFPFTNTPSSRVHSISNFFVCFLSEVIVVFSHATARFGSGRGRPYSRLISTSSFRYVLMVFHSCEASGISSYMGSLPFGSAENVERRQYRTRPRSLQADL